MQGTKQSKHVIDPLSTFYFAENNCTCTSVASLSTFLQQKLYRRLESVWGNQIILSKNKRLFLYDISKQEIIPDLSFEFESFLTDGCIFVLKDCRVVVVLQKAKDKLIYVCDFKTKEKRLLLKTIHGKSIIRQLKNGDIIVGTANGIFIFDSQLALVEQVTINASKCGRIVFNAATRPKTMQTQHFYEEWCRDVRVDYPKAEVVATILQEPTSTDFNSWTMEVDLARLVLVNAGEDFANLPISQDVTIQAIGKFNDGYFGSILLNGELVNKIETPDPLGIPSVTQVFPNVIAYFLRNTREVILWNYGKDETVRTMLDKNVDYTCIMGFTFLMH